MTGTKTEWIRVNSHNRCPICSRKDWCLYTAEGVVICMREPSEQPIKSGGWLHHVGENKPHRVDWRDKHSDKPAEPLADPSPVWNGWRERTGTHRIDALADDLGVSPLSITKIGAAWAPDSKKYCSLNGAWAFPMRDHTGKIIGIRFRNTAGEKRAMMGTHSGLFIPEYLAIEGPLFICEGPTDTAALLSMSIPAIGRPSCQGCIEFVTQYLERKKVRRVVLVSDADEPGHRGMGKLQEKINVPSCIWIPPAKDVRAFLKAGGTRDMIKELMSDTVWNVKKK
jgi:5S rRNA maturation endonuclease (ribonuclease M5)